MPPFKSITTFESLRDDPATLPDEYYQLLATTIELGLIHAGDKADLYPKDNIAKTKLQMLQFGRDLPLNATKVTLQGCPVLRKDRQLSEESADPRGFRLKEMHHTLLKQTARIQEHRRPIAAARHNTSDQTEVLQLLWTNIRNATNLIHTKKRSAH